MPTFFVGKDSKQLRDFLKSKNVEIVTDYPNMTGITVRTEEKLFFLGLMYGEHLTQHTKDEK